MKKLLFLLPAALLFTGCNGLYVIPVPINNTYYSSESYYTPNNDYYLVNGQYVLLPVQRYRYKYQNGRRLVFLHNSFISVYSHNHYIKHRKYNTSYKKYRKVNKYRKINKYNKKKNSHYYKQNNKYR